MYGPLGAAVGPMGAFSMVPESLFLLQKMPARRPMIAVLIVAAAVVVDAALLQTYPFCSTKLAWVE